MTHPSSSSTCLPPGRTCRGRTIVNMVSSIHQQDGAGQQNHSRVKVPRATGQLLWYAPQKNTAIEGKNASFTRKYRPSVENLWLQSFSAFDQWWSWGKADWCPVGSQVCPEQRCLHAIPQGAPHKVGFPSLVFSTLSCSEIILLIKLWEFWADKFSVSGQCHVVSGSCHVVRCTCLFKNI